VFLPAKKPSDTAALSISVDEKKPQLFNFQAGAAREPGIFHHLITLPI